MTELNYRFAWCLFGLLSVALLSYGFAFGFSAFLALLCGFALVSWGYWRLVVARPRMEAVGAFIGQYLGQRFYLAL